LAALVGSLRVARANANIRLLKTEPRGGLSPAKPALFLVPVFASALGAFCFWPTAAKKG
jgi:hypothetical protein